MIYITKKNHFVEIIKKYKKSDVRIEFTHAQLGLEVNCACNFDTDDVLLKEKSFKPKQTGAEIVRIHFEISFIRGGLRDPLIKLTAQMNDLRADLY